MFDEVQIGWLDNDDYRRAAERAGVVELPDGMDGTDNPIDPIGLSGIAEPAEPARAVLGLPGEVAHARWHDPNPPAPGQ